MTLRFLAVLLGLSLVIPLAPVVVTDDAPRPLDLAKDITLPPGFVIERIAGPPVVKHPLHISFDDQGQAYVTDMAGVNRNAKELEKELPNCIKRLTDTGGDGQFDQATVFTDKLTFPGGVLWHEGAVYATAFPHLWKFVDKDGDGVAEERVPLVGKFGSVGNAADLHGPQLGPDGRLYFCDGRNGHELTLGDGTKVKGRAAGLYRCRLDGCELDRVFAGGMDNPVEVAFTSAGEPLVCANIVLNNPRHDAILLGLEGGVYPHDLRAVKELKWTGLYLPIMGDLGWVAVSSVVRFDSVAWGPRWRDKYFTAEFNTHKVRQHTIVRDGAGFKMTSAEFLTCNHPDFHPTQVVQAADGSLILVDTGGWFRNGCPTSQVAKPDVLGGIYRIRKKEMSTPAKFAVRREEKRSVEKLTDDLSSEDVSTRRSALWALARHDTAAATEAVRTGLDDKDLDTRLLALRLVGLKRDAEAFERVAALLEHDHPAVRREAAEVLGRLKKSDAVFGLYTALAHTDDPYLEHAIIYALISINDPRATAQGFSQSSPKVLRGVLLALDPMEETSLSWDQVAPLLQTEDPRLKQAVLEVVAKRTSWRVELADYLERELTRNQFDEVPLRGLRNLIIALAAEPRVQQSVADRLVCPEAPGVLRAILLEVMAQTDLPRWPALWDGPLQTCLAERTQDDELLMHGILAAAASGKRSFDGVLRQIAESSERPLPVRLAAAGVALQDGQPVPTPLFRTLTQACRTDQEPIRRLTAARALGFAMLSEEQLAHLTDVAGRAGPLELPLLLGAWERQPATTSVPKLLAALDKSPGLTAVTPDRLAKLFTRVPDELRPAAQRLLTKGRGDGASHQARLQQFKPALTGGDAGRGRLVFFGAKAVCSTCHRIGQQGGLVGPNLSQIGAVRTREDLLESIILPNNSIARGFETYVVVTKDGKPHTGVLTRETVTALVLTNAQRQEERIPRREIEEMTTSAVSTMPNGLDQSLTVDEIRDLLAYLQTLKK